MWPVDGWKRSELLHLDVEVKDEERWHSVVLQHSVVALALEALFGKVL